MTKLIPSTKQDESVITTAIERPNNQFLDSILGIQYDVLDHGFIRVVDYMGGDTSIVQAARTSYGKGTKQISQDKGLIRYLLRHRHTSCFEMAEIKLHVKLPIFVARQWIRHRMASVNEYSARYSLIEDEFYIPSPENLALQSTDNKQGRGQILEEDKAKKVMNILQEDSSRCYKNYSEIVDEEGDIQLARELARINLTLNCYTQWYWKIDLHNLLHFLTLRADSHSQYEIRVYAELIAEILKGWCPITYDAWKDYRVNAMEISVQHIELLKKALLFVASNKSELLNCPEGMSKSEHKEFINKLGLQDYLT